MCRILRWVVTGEAERERERERERASEAGVGGRANNIWRHRRPTDT